MQRDFTSMIMCFDKKDMKKARELLQKFRMYFGTEMEKGNKKDVYLLNMQFFPLTHETDKKV